jgi:hypothetical protein
VDFKSPDDLSHQTGKKFFLMNQQKANLPLFLFDGTVMFTIQKVNQNDGPLILTSHYDSGDEKIPVEISIRLIKDVHRTETGYLQVMNQVNKEIQRAMNLKQVGASFFDTSATVKYGQHRLEICLESHPPFVPESIIR